MTCFNAFYARSRHAPLLFVRVVGNNQRIGICETRKVHASVNQSKNATIATMIGSSPRVFSNLKW